MSILKDPPIWYCYFTFKNEECGYTGDDLSCTKLFDDCKAKNNLFRFPSPNGYDLLTKTYIMRPMKRDEKEN